MEKRKVSRTDIMSFFTKRPRVTEDHASTTDDPVCLQPTPNTSQLTADVPIPTTRPTSSGDEQVPFTTAADERVAMTTAAEQVPLTAAGDEQVPVTTAAEQVPDDDVGKFQRSELCDDDKLKLMKNHFRPDNKFDFPVRQHRCKNLKFKLSWLDHFPWLVYSKVKNGGYCLPCVLFATKPGGRGCEFGVLIQKPFTDFRKALGKKDGILPNHETNTFHKLAVAAFAERKHVEENPADRIDIQLEKLKQNRYSSNKTALGSIIECIIYLGRQGIALRGHRDTSTADPDTNKGNLQELIQFRAKTDDSLRSFMKSCPKNATYVSNTTQNEVLEILGDVIRESLTANITEERCPFFSIIADELTDDIANKHILSLCIRFLEYVDGRVSDIQEGLLDFSYTERGTAAHLVKMLRSKLVDCGLNPLNVRGQSYDTTSCMSSDNQGVQGIFRREVPRAVYTPCNSHKLNLVIASASKLPQIRNCVTAVNNAFLFFNLSHKRQGFFEKVMKILHAREGQNLQRQKKLKGLCKTRWVERFQAFDNFIDMAPMFMTTCDIIVNPHLYENDAEISALIEEKWSWDGETKTKAQGILANFREFETIVSLIVLRNVLAPLREITIKLQQRDLDVRTAYSLLSSVKEDVGRMRAEVDDRFDGWYVEIKKIAGQLDAEEQTRRRARSNVFRATHLADDPKEYFKRAIVIPFIDDVNTQLADRFSDQSVSVISGFMSLIPSVIVKMDVKEIPTVVDKLSDYEPDIDSLASLQTELEIWRGRWIDSENTPDSLLTSLKCCPKDLFPNLHTLLQLGCLIPVTSCEAERSFSAVRRIKTTLRSSMREERLSALVLLNTYRRVNINVEDIVERFILKKPRRLFSNLCE